MSNGMPGMLGSGGSVGISGNGMANEKPGIAGNGMSSGMPGMVGSGGSAGNSGNGIEKLNPGNAGMGRLQREAMAYGENVHLVEATPASPVGPMTTLLTPSGGCMPGAPAMGGTM